MLIRTSSPDVAPSEVTPENIYLRRRQILQGILAGGAVLLAGGNARASTLNTRKSAYSTTEAPNTRQQISSYNNFYEFGTDKSDPAERAGRFVARPWAIKVDGEVHRPRTFDLDELLKLAPLEERIYRLRCVEGWSMVIPWVGYALATLIRQVEPATSAKFVEFTSVLRPAEMPGQHSAVLDWPYIEALRIDEAAHPLTLLAFGLYGETLPNQNGAPARIVVPWKYGFKSAKSIVRIRFTEKPSITSWMKAGPSEYGFFSNVNPMVDHPRWSQASERRIGEFFKRRTLMFNGYADQVGSMYAGLDLRKYF